MKECTKVYDSALVSGACGGRRRSGAEKRPSSVLKGAALAAVALGLMLMKAAPSKAEDADDIVSNGAQPIAYDISPANDGTNIAVGKNAKVFIGGGTQESMLSFGETVEYTNFGLSMNIHGNTAAKQNLPAGIAVGTNTYARTGSIQIGDHTLEKNKIAIGDTTADKLRQFGVASTTLGTNSYTGGGFATTLGSYNVQSSQYEAGGLFDYSNTAKNAFATVVGTLNSNESMSGSSSSGVANVINGAANKVTNSNGAIVIGAGNSVKESSASFDASAYSKHFDSVTAMQKALMDGVAKSAGGAVLAIGGANAAEYAQSSQMMGVGNKLTGTSGAVSKYNLIDGYKNTARNVNHVSVIGSENTVENTDTALLLGDKRKLTGANYSVVLGSTDAEKELKVADAVLIGHNADVQKEGGVALGSGSTADRGAFTTETEAPFSKVKLNDTNTLGAVSVGGNGKLRQIVNVGDGTEDTDAVNVRQLQAVADAAANAAGAANADMYFHVNPGAGVAPVGTNKGPMTATAGAGGANSLAAGINAKTGKDAEKSVAIGYGSYAKEPGAVSIGNGAGGEYGAGISIGDGSVSQRSTSLAIGTGAKTGHGNGPTAGGGDIAVGDQSFVENYVNQSGGIAIGQKSHVENMYGSRESSFAFGQTDYSGGTPADPSKVATGIAIGQNSFARTGSLMVGTHNYRGLMGDVTVDSADTKTFNLDINSTTLGTNSYNEGAFSTVTGAYSIASGNYSTGRAKNFGANIYGALNSIESETAAVLFPASPTASSARRTARSTPTAP
ncbi:hypothetical protein [Pyramidobacter sp. C12-8]|uniref:hypothetical protein n=1 Tax=Pyramidobacter sp. C12-8 TaxID=1943580 RepID=UPI0009C7F0FF|nr:hypothetical protein [Pyramidobacter sp. C12-8]OON89236.1 hypothetical protein B0D78_04450 [Pyramidobacter sp. C12-8]